jgi:hypothetical protein
MTAGKSLLSTGFESASPTKESLKRKHNEERKGVPETPPHKKKIPEFNKEIPTTPEILKLPKPTHHQSPSASELLRQSKEILTPKSQANDRLQRLRCKLAKEVQQDQNSGTSQNPSLSQTSLNMEMEWLASSSDIDKKSDDTAGIEPMEWDSIDEQEVIDQVNSIRTFKLDSNHNVRNDTGDRTVSQETDAFYVILDTNILISNLEMLANIKGQYFKGNFFFIFGVCPTDSQTPKCEFFALTKCVAKKIYSITKNVKNFLLKLAKIFHSKLSKFSYP